MQYSLVEDVFKIKDGGTAFLRNVRKCMPDLIASRPIICYHRPVNLKSHMLPSPKISIVQNDFDSVCMGMK
jgi:hypothetical protein